jgi:uncharacterized protein YhaN
MKILSLRLKPYGPFTDNLLDFGDGQGSFHLIYGPNESGKTATLRALKALLFGIPERTSDDFKHDGKKLRIGASLRHSDGSILTFQRRKGRSKTLLTEDERELSDIQIEKFLGGVDESAFGLMFAFGHEDLVRGGKEIASGKGDVGQSLFAAGAGISGLHKVRQTLDEEAGELFKQRASKPAINEAIARYKEAKREIKDSGLQSSWWLEHERLRKAAEDRKEDVKKTLDTLQAKLNRLERILQALPIIAERNDVLSQKRLLGDVLVLPDSFKTERIDALKSLELAKADEKRADTHIKTIKEKIGLIAIPEGLLSQKAVIENIYVRLGSYQKEMEDLPTLREQYIISRTEVERLFSELRPGASLDEAEKLRMGASKRQRALTLAAQHEGLEEKLGGIIEQIDSLKLKKSSAENEFQKTGQPVDTGRLKKVTVSIRKEGDIEKALEKAKLGLRKAEDSIQKGLSRLSLWKGTAEELEGLLVPLPETIDRYETEINRINNNLAQLELTIKDKTDELEQIETDMTELDRSGVVPTETDLELARYRRDEGWRLVKGIWVEREFDEDKARAYSPELPLDQAYERSVSEADQIADRLRRETDRVSKKAILLSNRSRLVENIKALETQKKEATAVKARLLEDWRNLWDSLGFDPLTPREMRSWLQGWQKLANDAENLRTLRDEAAAIEKRISTSRSSLMECLGALGYEAKGGQTLSEMIDESQEVIDANDDIAREKDALRRSIKGLVEQLAEAKRKEKNIRAEVAIWREKWKEEMADMDLAVDTVPSAASDYITRSQDLIANLDNAHGFEKRITAIEKNMGDFENDVRRLMERVSHDLSALPAVQAASELHSRLGKAVEDNATLMNLRQDLSDRARELESAKDAIVKAEMSIQALLKEAKCEHIDQLRDVEEKSDREQSLKNKLDLLGKQLFAYSAGVKIEQFIAEAQGADPDSLPNKIKDLQTGIETLRAESSGLEQTIGAEAAMLKQADGSSQAAAAAEKAQYAASQIEEFMERYIKLRLAAAILKNEIERYRARNQGPVLERASQVFSLLTSGSFSGLRTTFDEKDAQILVGGRKDIDEDVTVEAMSEGTCDQLYLALRLASIEKYIESSEPVPLVFDDILVNFDDERAAACLIILSEISRKTQIIYFTHHQHILNLALKSLSPSVLKVHHLH